MFNLKPNGDYLTIRANCLENNLVLWKFEKGKRSSVKWVRNTPTATKQWHELKVRVSGTKVEGYLDGKLYLEDTLAQPVSGRIGLWSKADSHMYFSDYTVATADWKACRGPRAQLTGEIVGRTETMCLTKEVYDAHQDQALCFNARDVNRNRRCCPDDRLEDICRAVHLERTRTASGLAKGRRDARSKAAVTGDVHRYGFPRTDLTVTLDGVTIKPAPRAWRLDRVQADAWRGHGDG